MNLSQTTGLKRGFCNILKKYNDVENKQRVSVLERENVIYLFLELTKK